ncbi:dynein axonemal heavy chain 6-like [Hypanus sabinus]|uniref:dynein axonemal heavy chain 6-like n=1 Tax=Hypanus sabinus TaxID=79690 RepID=UPI0028C4BC65|nr:dynein axonemal heavy chain 6-like [Hypanus sabinus]
MQPPEDLLHRIYSKPRSPGAFKKSTVFQPATPSQQLPDNTTCTLRTSIYRKDIPNRRQQWMKWEERGKYFHSKSLRSLVERQEGHPSKQTEQELNPVSETELSLEPKFLPHPEVQEYQEQSLDDKDTVLISSEPEDNFEDGAMHHILRLRNSLGWETVLPNDGPSLKIRTAQFLTINQLQVDVMTPKEDTGDFVYCLSRTQNDPRARYDPYNLQVVSAKTAKSYKPYWTISASHVSKVTSITEKDGIETISALDWLLERYLFYKIHQLPVFVKFRKWKAFNVWKVNVCSSKTSRSRMIMMKQLFVADVIFQRCLYYIQALCEAASSSNRGLGSAESAIVFVKLDRNNSYSYEEFAEIQSEQCKYALKQLCDLRYKIIQSVKETCLQLHSHTTTSCARKATAEGFRKLFVAEPSDLSKRPTFTEIVESRPLLMVFIRFLKLVDHLFQELLSRLVKTAVRLLLEAMTASYAVTSTDARRNEQLLSTFPHKIRAQLDRRLRNILGDSETSSQDYKTSKGVDTNESKPEELTDQGAMDMDQVLQDVKQQTKTETMAPMFIVNLTLDIPSKHIILPRDSTKAKCRARNKVCRTAKVRQSFDRLQISDESRDIDCSLQDTSESGIDIQEEMEEGSEYKHPAQYILSPTSEDLLTQVHNIVRVLEEIVAKLVSFTNEPCLSMFNSQSLYEMKLSSDQELEAKKTKRFSLNADILFGQDPIYQQHLTKLQNLIRASMAEVTQYSRKFEQYSVMVDQAMNLDLEALVRQQEWSPGEFRSMLEVYTEYVMSVRNMTVERRVRLVKVVSQQYQADCFPYLEMVIHELHNHLKNTAYKKSSELLSVIEEAQKNLSKEPETIDMFGKHLLFLSRMEIELPKLERKFQTVTQLYGIANEYGVSIPPEEVALYQILVPTFHSLKSNILYFEAIKESNIKKFSENLERDISNLYNDLMQVKYKVRNPALLQAATSPHNALETINALMLEVSSIASRARTYSNYQDRFCSSGSIVCSVITISGSMQKWPGRVSSQSLKALLSETEYELMLMKLLRESEKDWKNLHANWMENWFDELNVDAIQKDVNRFTQTIHLLEKGLPPNDSVPLLKQAVFDFKEMLPIIVALRNPWLESQHWDTIEYTVGRSIKDKHLTLENFMKLRVFQHKDVIVNTSSLATNQGTLRSMLEEVITQWKQTSFKLVSHQLETSTVLIIGSTEEVVTQLEESLNIISTIKSSRYMGPLENEVLDWNHKLNQMALTLEEWMTCQRNWLYLKSIFQAPDIQRQLAAETKLFAQIEVTCNELVMRVQKNSNILKITSTAGILELLQATNANLEKLLKCLEDYLEAKRIAFPRFYFLSNNDLLDILSRSRNLDAIQPHLAKCFENIKSLEISSQSARPPVVLMLKSAENENLPLPRNVWIRGPIESWLGNMESAMFEAVRKHLQVGITDWGSTQFKKWVLSHPGQIVLTVSQIMFNRDCMNCFRGTKPQSQLQGVHLELMNRLDMLAELVCVPLRPSQETVLESLVTINVHCRDVLGDLIVKKVFKTEDFEWTRQLRYEWNTQNNSCYVMHTKSSFVYGYEYLGCSPRLVITPLTDRCWLTLTGALNFNLGGLPSGPSGTGKTATVKDLAKALGKFCVVFNCSKGLDYKMMANLFSGIAQSGAWICFDEFNRIDVEVLSVTASQIQTIKAAKDSEAMKFVFGGREIRLNMSCGFFATMNPGYKGRVELPDNLKSLFRPVAMMVPDAKLIAEVTLFSQGFKSARSLSGKVINLYQLACQQLSQQDHYDFGMRSIKSVLLLAGKRKRALEARDAKKSLNHTDESHILINALKDANVTKFLAEDVPLFGSILTDLFPGLTPPKDETLLLQKAIGIATLELGFQSCPSQEEKIIQLYSQILVRHGVMLVGPTCGGKTVARMILQKALVILPGLVPEAISEAKSLSSSIGKKGKVEIFTVNPKSISLRELYGYLNPRTMTWTDGLLTQAMRKFAKDLHKDHGREPEMKLISPSFSNVERSWTELQDHKSQEREDMTLMSSWRWIIMDGPVDTVWIENLNTVLDDTKTLCLSNGERISFPPGMRLLFEVDSLSQASPATISRCAMVYMDPVDLGWQPYVRTWLAKLPEQLPQGGRECLQTLFDKSMSAGLRFVRKWQQLCQFNVPDLGIVMTLCRILQALLDFLSRNGGFGAGVSASSSEEVSDPKGLFMMVTPEESPGGQDNQASSGSRPARWFLQKQPNQLPSLLAKLYVFSFTWAVGGCLKHEDDCEEDDLVGVSDRVKEDMAVKVTLDFNTFVQKMFGGKSESSVQFPAEKATVFEYFVDMQTGKYVTWDKLVPSTQMLISKAGAHLASLAEPIVPELPRSKPTIQGLVHTVDTVRYSFLISLLLLNKCPVLLTGESGNGKSALIREMLSTLEKSKGSLIQSETILGNVFLYNEMKHESLVSGLTQMFEGFSRKIDKGTACIDGVCSGTRVDLAKKHITQAAALFSRENKEVKFGTMLMSTQTTSAQTQAQILRNLVKRSRSRQSAERNKQVIVFVDDLNMPAVEKYGAQPPLELIRQFLDLGGFFDVMNLKWLQVEDLTLVAACAPPGGARSELSQRLLKHFCTFTLPQPSTKSMQHIFQVKVGCYLESHNFMPVVQNCRKQLVSAAISMYYKMSLYMLPTPVNPHYTFNVRDLVKVIDGLLRADNTDIVSKNKAMVLFAHEVTRVFHDRLSNTKDRQMFYNFLSDDLHNYFKSKLSPADLIDSCFLFGDFLDLQASSNSRVYQQITDWARLESVLEQYHLRQSLGNTKVTPPVFFKEAVEHIVRAVRVFTQPSGYLMMVGLDSTGKITNSSLACYVADCELFTLSIGHNYNHSDFREDLKRVFKQTGVHGVNTVLLLTDFDLLQASFLEDLNYMVNLGQVPGLFESEELDNVIMELKKYEREGNISDNKEALYRFFLQRVHDRLHIVLALSTTGQMFRQWCRTNPSLVSCSTIDWYDRWPKEAQLKVANAYFAHAEFEEVLKEKVAKACVDIHNSISVALEQMWQQMRRHYYITPSKYMELIHTFSNLFTAKKKKILNARNRFANGLEKLSEASSLIGVMQEELVPLGAQIEKKTKEVEQLMKKLQDDTDAMEEVRAIVKQEEEIMAEETQVVQEYAEQATSELKNVLPVLGQAVSALQALDKSDISEIRVYNSPPTLVLTVMNAVCVLLQKPPQWATAKLLLSDPSFLKHLLSLDKDKIPEKVFLKLKTYSKQPDFSPERVGNVSTACRSLCQWVLALEHYHEVRKAVEPKQQKVLDAQEVLAIARSKLREKNTALKLVEDHQLSLQQAFNKALEQKEALAARKLQTTQRLSRASLLITALTNEETRWKECLDDLDRQVLAVVGDTLLSAACITYYGPFTAHYRQNLLNEWKSFCAVIEIPVSPEYALIPATTEKNEVRNLQNRGLPPDNYSTENAILVKMGERWPLLIDPQGQAVRWIKKMEGGDLCILLATHHNYMSKMLNAIRMGHPVLLHDVTEQLDPCLRPILLRNICTRAEQDFIKIDNTEVEYNPNFRLYMTTRISNPNFLPAVCILVTLINFTATFEGLQEQLLSRVVKQQHPEMEEKLGQLLESIVHDLGTLQDLENRSLSLLQKSEGHILDDQDLIDTLQKSKDMSKEIKLRIEASEENEKKITAARQKYLPVATRGSILYFVVDELSQLNCMYQFSLHWFMKIFTESVGDIHKSRTRMPQSGTSQSASLQRSRWFKSSTSTPLHSSFNSFLQSMIKTLTKNVYKLVRFAIFTDHQLCFSFMLCTSIMRINKVEESDHSSMGTLPEAEWQIFLHSEVLAKVDHGQRSQDTQSLEEDKWFKQSRNAQWMSEATWSQCLYITTQLTPFALLCRSLNSQPQQWEDFRQAEELHHFLKTPFRKQMPLSKQGLSSQGISTGSHRMNTEPEDTIFPWELLSAFQRLILIKILRPECLTAAVSMFVEEKLGSDFLPSPAVYFSNVFDETDASTPLIFLLSPGTDPIAQVLRFAKEFRGSTAHLDTVSLGQGQGLVAEELIHKVQVLKGRWVFLQNCHLAASFMPTLQAIVESFKQPGVNLDPDFRLFLSSKSDQTFPISILQDAMKVTVEPPKGLKNKLLTAYGSSGLREVTERIYRRENSKLGWRRLLFSLCLFNSVIQERNKYGALGWNLPYEFTSSDLEVAILNLEILLQDEAEIPWEALRYLTGEVVYGGRVADHWDRRCLNSMLSRFYSPEILQQGFSFSTNGVYTMIAENRSLHQCIKYMESLPSTDSADIFGMHTNAESAYLESQAKEFMTTIKNIEPRLSSGVQTLREQHSQDEIVLEKVEGILRKLPETVEDVHGSESNITDLAHLLASSSWATHVASVKGFDCLANFPLLTVLRHEINCYNQLLQVVISSLNSLCQGVKGKIILTPTLEEMYNCFLSLKMPKLWQLHSYDSCKPLGSWIDDLVDRVNFFRTWSVQFVAGAQQRIVVLQEKPASQWSVTQQACNVNPSAFWLSAFFYPQGFLVALLQNHARKHGVPMDSLTFSFHILPFSKDTEDHSSPTKHRSNTWTMAFKGRAAPDDGAVLFGFYLDGASWDPEVKTLKDCSMGQRFCKMPAIHFLPVKIDSQKGLSGLVKHSPVGEQHYECPMYRTSQRAGSLSTTSLSSAFIIAVHLPTTLPAEHWVLRGVALVCQMDN